MVIRARRRRKAAAAFWLMEKLAEFFGRLHPLFLHFPIALLWAGGVAELARVRQESAFTARLSIWLLGAGALLALGAAGSGWFLAAFEKVRGDERATLEWHRWLGLATAVSALVAWRAVAIWRELSTPTQAWLRRAVVLATVSLVTAAGHLGAVLVWGKDWFSFHSP